MSDNTVSHEEYRVCGVGRDGPWAGAWKAHRTPSDWDLKQYLKHHDRVWIEFRTVTITPNGQREITPDA